MRMMDCGDSKEFKLPDSLKHRKLRPIMPRPIVAPSCGCIHKTNLFTSNYHLEGAMTEESNKTEVNTETMASSRWNPTPEQLNILEEMYRNGTRTPSAEQIQQIAAKLRRFGKIEGKNVFYWFQNHKARERQKRRRLQYSFPRDKICDMENSAKKQPELNRTSLDVGQEKNWGTPTSFLTLSQESVSVHRAVEVEHRTEGRIQFEERELQQSCSSRKTVTKLAMWQPMMQQSSIHLINTRTTNAVAAEALEVTEQSLSHPQRPRKWWSPNNLEDECRETQTLQLFPICKDDGLSVDFVKETDRPITFLKTNFIPNQFFEFLPIRN